MIGLRRALLALAAVGVALGAMAIELALASNHDDAPGVTIALGLIVGWGFIGVGLFAWWRRPENRTGALMTAVGFTWFIGALTESNDPVVFSLSAVLGSVSIGVLVQFLLAFPSGRLQSRQERWIVGVTYGLLTVGNLLPMLFMRSSECRCSVSDHLPRNVLMVHHDRALANGIGIALGVAGIFVAGAIMLILWRRWHAASRPARRILAPVLWSGFATTAFLALHLGTQSAGVSNGVNDALNLLALIALASVPYAFLGGIITSRMSRAGKVGALVFNLGAQPSRVDLRDALAEALGDRSLSLAYWVPELGRHVAADGSPVELPKPGSGRTSTTVERDGTPIAAILHDATLAVNEPELVEAAGAAAALALENERLDAELRARVQELRASRARIVEASYEERRRIERNLHDGAQQRLVSLAIDLGLARSKVATEPEKAAALIDDVQSELQVALEELRELARGIHPGILADRGLGPAIAALAGRAPLPVELSALPDERLPPAVEAAAYYVVSEALTNVARYAEAHGATVNVARHNGHALVEVRDDGVGGADVSRGSGLRGLSDRVAALGGRLEVDSPSGSGTIVRAEIPCAS